MKSRSPHELMIKKAESLLNEANMITSAFNLLNSDYKTPAIRALRVFTIDELKSVAERVVRDVEEKRSSWQSRYLNEEVWIRGVRKPNHPDFRFSAMTLPKESYGVPEEQAKTREEFFLPPEEFLNTVNEISEKVRSGDFDAHLFDDPSLLLFKESLSLALRRLEEKPRWVSVQE